MLYNHCTCICYIIISQEYIIINTQKHDIINANMHYIINHLWICYIIMRIKICYLTLPFEICCVICYIVIWYLWIKDFEDILSAYLRTRGGVGLQRARPRPPPVPPACEGRYEGHPPSTTSAQGNSGLPTRTDGRFQKVTRTNIYSILYIPIWTYTFLIIYSNKRILFLIIYLNRHILHFSYPDLIIYAIRYIRISLYTFVVI
jgi:hypothetical protein